MQRASLHNLKIIGSEKETIVFSHGFGCDQSTWNKLIPNLKDHYRLVLFDTIGSGKTDPSLFSADRYSNLYSYAEDLILLMDELKIRNSLYVGHSVSGMIGLITSIRRPELFSKLAFISASPRYLNDTNYKGGFEQTDLDQLFAAMETNFFLGREDSPPCYGKSGSSRVGPKFCRIASGNTPGYRTDSFKNHLSIRS